MLNNFNDEFGIPEPDCKVDDDEKLRTPSKKRGVPNDSATPTTNKKVKANPLTLTELKDLTDALKCECALPNFKGGARSSSRSGQPRPTWSTPACYLEILPPTAGSAVCQEASSSSSRRPDLDKNIISN